MQNIYEKNTSVPFMVSPRGDPPWGNHILHIRTCFRIYVTCVLRFCIIIVLFFVFFPYFGFGPILVFGSYFSGLFLHSFKSRESYYFRILLVSRMILNPLKTVIGFLNPRSQRCFLGFLAFFRVFCMLFVDCPSFSFLL